MTADKNKCPLLFIRVYFSSVSSLCAHIEDNPALEMEKRRRKNCWKGNDDNKRWCERQRDRVSAQQWLLLWERDQREVGGAGNATKYLLFIDDSSTYVCSAMWCCRVLNVLLWRHICWQCSQPRVESSNRPCLYRTFCSHFLSFIFFWSHYDTVCCVNVVTK